MLVSVSLVIGDASPEGIRITVSEDPDHIRHDLLVFYNEAVMDGGLPEGAPLLMDTSNTPQIADHIRRWVGRSVVVFPAVDVE